MQRAFKDLLAGRGLTANEAEVIVRWLWKFEGLQWRFNHQHPRDRYTSTGATLRQRVLNRIDPFRTEIVLAVTMVDRIDDDFTDEPMGFDSTNESNAIFMAGVFSRIALLSMLRVYSYGLPKGFTVIDMPTLGASDADAKLYYPRAGFALCTDAVGYMRLNAPQLARLHDETLEEMERARLAELSK